MMRQRPAHSAEPRRCIMFHNLVYSIAQLFPTFFGKVAS